MSLKALLRPLYIGAMRVSGCRAIFRQFFVNEAFFFLFSLFPPLKIKTWSSCY